MVARSRRGAPYGGVAGLLLGRLEVQGDTVDAVPQPGRRRTIFEHVTEMSPAPAAVHLGAPHPEAAIRRRADRAVNRCEETGPARAAFELAVGDEETLSAAG